ncbi:MAG: PHP-associated domain-containing protein [Isosphaeraceae bacterium]|nr:PHP-associated domain-containing protein [Isosphaeraceae bacterium]
MKIDHHLHTSRHSPDSVIEPHQLIRSARDAGLDGVVITEHDYQWREDELADLQESAGDLLVLAGAEISAIEGHMLVYGLPHLDDVPPGVSVRRVLEVAEYHDAVVVAAHPYRWGQDFRAILAQVGARFDGLELVSNNVGAAERSLIESTLSDHPVFGATGSSDAHEPEVVGCYYSVFPEPIRSMHDFVSALRRRRSAPRHHASKRLASGPIEWAARPASHR